MSHFTEENVPKYKFTLEMVRKYKFTHENLWNVNKQLIVNKQFVWEQFLTIIQIISTVSEEDEKMWIGLTQDKQWYG